MILIHLASWKDHCNNCPHHIINFRYKMFILNIKQWIFIKVGLLYVASKPDLWKRQVPIEITFKTANQAQTCFKQLLVSYQDLTYIVKYPSFGVKNSLPNFNFDKFRLLIRGKSLTKSSSSQSFIPNPWRGSNQIKSKMYCTSLVGDVI